MTLESPRRKNIEPQAESAEMGYEKGVRDGKAIAYSDASEMVSKVLFSLENLSHSIDSIVCRKIRNEVIDLKANLKEKVSTQDGES
jgi:flagellar biosynthesis/type III secretory pathway protein FliH